MFQSKTNKNSLHSLINYCQPQHCTCTQHRVSKAEVSIASVLSPSVTVILVTGVIKEMQSVIFMLYGFCSLD